MWQATIRDVAQTRYSNVPDEVDEAALAAADSNQIWDTPPQPSFDAATTLTLTLPCDAAFPLL